MVLNSTSLQGLFSLLRIKSDSRHFDDNWMNFKLSQGNFAKCILALKLSWPPSVVNLNSMLRSSSISLLWPKEFLHSQQEYDKLEVKERAFHCLWWQEANLFAKMSLLNIGVTLAPPSYLYQHQTKPGPVQLALKSIFSLPFAHFPMSSLILLWPVTSTHKGAVAALW